MLFFNMTYFVHLTKAPKVNSGGPTVATTKKNGSKAKAKHINTEPKPSASSRKVDAEGAGDAKVTMDCRTGKDRRVPADRRQKDIVVPVERRQLERRVKVNRRRQIDPTTCERDYSLEEIEFMSALDDYKRRSGRMFPTCSEILEVLRGLGYEKRPAALVATALTESVGLPSSMEQAI